MFVQVIQGQVTDRSAVKEKVDQWLRELAPGATGWLGTTAGVTADGRFIALARFESAEAAQANSTRPEQDQWFQSMRQLFSAPPTFHDSTDIVLDIVGDPDQAGFVQIIQGRGTDPERAKALMATGDPEWAAYRPDVLASVGSMYDGGGYTMAIYFTSEADARVGEKKEAPPKIKAQMDEMQALNVGVPEFFDLTDPWLYSR